MLHDIEMGHGYSFFGNGSRASHVEHPSLVNSAALFVELLDPCESLSVQRNHSAIDIFVRELNGRISRDLRKRKNNNELIPDFQIKHCWAGMEASDKGIQYSLILLISLEVYEELVELPLEYAGLDKMISQSWKSVLGKAVKMKSGYVKFHSLAIPRYVLE